jgi:Meiotic cell cortex C-terminal pleckstrin homology
MLFSAYIESVKAVMDPNPMPPGLHQYSVIVTTANREMKFTAPTKERHDIWFNVSFTELQPPFYLIFIRPSITCSLVPPPSDSNLQQECL